MSLSEASAGHVRATNRVSAILFLSIALIAIALLIGSVDLYLGVALLMLTASLRSYTVLASLALARVRVYTKVIGGRVEGERMEVIFDLENRSWVPIAIAELSLSYSPNLKLVEGVRAGMVLIPPRSSVRYRVVFIARVGRHVVGPLRAVVRDPLGLFRSVEMEIARSFELMIIPRTSEATIRRLLVHTRSTGITRSREPGLGVEFHSVREYRPGDDIRRIDWKHFAAVQRLVVKEMEKEAFQSVLFILDATSPMFYGPYSITPFEHTSRVIATIARYLSSRGDLMGLIAFSNKYVITSGKISRGKLGYRRILNTIAGVEFDTSPISGELRGLQLDGAVRRAVMLLPRERNLVFTFTTAGDNTYLEAIVRSLTKLQSLGNEVFVVIPISTAYEIEGLSQAARAVYRVKTYERMKQELIFARQLRIKGVKTLALGPQHIPQIVVRIIESMQY
ncbi:MAG: DUF58 domain-containing protein [Sulfolobales archaeon]